MNRNLKFALIVAFFAIGTLSSCKKKGEKMTVIKDCTGVYLRSKSGQDSYVCNDAILSSYATGEEIRVKFDAIEECYGLIEEPACPDDHTFVNKIDVLEVND